MTARLLASRILARAPKLAVKPPPAFASRPMLACFASKTAQVQVDKLNDDVPDHITKDPNQLPRKEEAMPVQRQKRQPGLESEMDPQPVYIRDTYRGSGKLQDKVALITGGDSGIGRAVAVHFAREGAHVAIAFKEEHEDAQKTQKLVEAEGRQCLLLPGDVKDSKLCDSHVQKTVSQFGRLDVLVNNAAIQHYRDEGLEAITDEQLDETFRTNIFGYFYMTRAAMPHLKEGSAIVNCTSVTAYKGSPGLLDYSSTKAAIVGFTRSLAAQVASKGIRVNAVAPGPIWTPLIVGTFPKEKQLNWGTGTPLGRPGQPCEVATAFVFLASEDSSYFSGQVLHPNGGTPVNG